MGCSVLIFIDKEFPHMGTGGSTGRRSSILTSPRAEALAKGNQVRDVALDLYKIQS